MSARLQVMTSFAVRVVFILLYLAGIHCFCKKEKIASGARRCAFKVHCFHTIEDLDLPAHCTGFTKHATRTSSFIDLYLSDDTAIKDVRNISFLASAKALRLNSPRPSEALGLLKYMPNLQHLYLLNNNIDEISDVAPLLLNSKLRTIDFSYNNLSYVDDLFMFVESPDVLRVYLSHNSIGHLPGEAFEQLTNLIELDLSYNLLTDLIEEPFNNLTNLQILRLNNNEIKDLNGAIDGLHNLKELHLRENYLSDIDSSILKVVKNLEKFDISKNYILTLATDIFFRNWKGSKSLLIFDIILAENNIDSIPNTTLEVRTTRDTNDFDAKMITNLNISKNAISEVGYNAFHGINRLTSLDLSSNHLNHLNLNRDDLKYLKFLYLKNNFIKSLDYKDLSPMTQLQFLDLSYNEISDISRWVFIDNRKLKHVNLAQNKIHRIENGVKLFHIDGGALDLSDNALSGIDIPFNDTFRITLLVLKSNLIIDAAQVNLEYHTSLQMLFMSQNQIDYLNALRLPKSLLHLDLSSNQMTGIRASVFKNLGSLRVLSLSNNEITRFDYGVFQGLGELQKLFLANNKLQLLESDVFGDLKSLQVLSLKNNNLNYLDSSAWLNHKGKINVYVDGNSLACNWVRNAFMEYDNGMSMMRPVVDSSANGPNVEGISCKNDEVMNIRDYSNNKLLFTSQKILEAIKHQTEIMEKLIKPPRIVKPNIVGQ